MRRILALLLALVVGGAHAGDNFNVLDGSPLSVTTLRTADGTVAAPSHSFTNFPTTGWYAKAGPILGLSMGAAAYGGVDTAGNIGFGSSANNAITSGTFNVAFGLRANRLNQSGTDNVAIGADALRTSTSVSNNVAIGNSALFAATTGDNNVVIGRNAGLALTSSTGNVFIGNQAGLSQAGTGSNDSASSVVIGNQAGKWHGSTGDGGNVIIGEVAGGQANGSTTNATAYHITAIGANALSALSQGVNNTAVGHSAGQLTTVGGSNAYFGRAAGQKNTTGGFNTEAGHAAGLNYTTGGSNSFFGNQAGNTQVTITGAANNGSGLIRITAPNHHLSTGHTITITGVTGTTEANSDWTITVITGNTLDLQSSTFTNAYVSGGTVQVRNRTGSSNVNVGELSGSLIPDGLNTVTVGTNAVTHLSNTAKIGQALTDTSISGRVYRTVSINNEATAAGVTYSTTQFLGTVVNRSGPGSGFSDTTPTAAALVALVPGCETNLGYELAIRNTTAFVLTMLAGSGVTLSGTTTVAATQTRRYLVQITNCSSGSEAVAVQGLYTAAN